MHAVLMAGGKGTRLHPYTVTTPKVLLPINGVPIIQSLIEQLRDEGIREFTVVVNHLADVIERKLGTGRRLGVEIDYYREEVPLDTAGCLGQFTPSRHPFLLINADVVTDLSFLSLASHHQATGALATIGLARHEVNVDFGVVESDAIGRLTGYVEKPSIELWVSMGIYCLNPRVRHFVEPGESISMPQLLTRLHLSGERVDCYRTNCNWRDIGRPEDYQQAVRPTLKLSGHALSRRAA